MTHDCTLVLFRNFLRCGFLKLAMILKIGDRFTGIASTREIISVAASGGQNFPDVVIQYLARIVDILPAILTEGEKKVPSSKQTPHRAYDDRRNPNLLQEEPPK